MWYYLHHYFDPEFDHQNPKPKADSQGSANLYNLDYVQNVLAGQVLAELRPLTQDVTPLPDKQFIMKDPVLPVGANTEIDPNNPNRLLSSINGYVFYYNKEITVKHLLNIHHSVDMRTGNITFVGDIVVHGDVHSDFQIRACNLLVKGIIEDAFIRTLTDIIAEGGFKGARRAKLIAGNDIYLAFCETGEIRAQNKIHIAGSCLHCNLYATKDIFVEGRLQGGTIRAGNKIYVAKRLGCNANVPTRVVLGENPLISLAFTKAKQYILQLEEKLSRFEDMVAQNKSLTEDFTAWHKLLAKKLEICQNNFFALKKQIKDSSTANEAMLVVPGEVMPGVEITIGQARFCVEQPMSDVRFCLQDDEIIAHYPALPPKARHVSS